MRSSTKAALRRVAVQRIDPPRPPRVGTETVIWDLSSHDGAGRARRDGRRPIAVAAVVGVVCYLWAVAQLVGVTTAPTYPNRGATDAAPGPFATAAAAARSGSALPGPAVTGAGPTAKLAYDLKLRREFGLDTDPAHVKAVENAPDSTDDQLGIALSPPERATLSARFHVQDTAAKTLLPGLEKRPGFGGAWFDQANGGTFHIASTGPDFSQAVQAALPAWFPVSYDHVGTPVAVLNRLVDQLVANVDTGAGHARWISSTNVDEPTNTVQIEVAMNAPAQAEAELRRLHPQPYVRITRQTAAVTFETMVGSRSEVTPALADIRGLGQR